jgi:hypothetical protein
MVIKVSDDVDSLLVKILPAPCWDGHPCDGRMKDKTEISESHGCCYSLNMKCPHRLFVECSVPSWWYYFGKYWKLCLVEPNWRK